MTGVDGGTRNEVTQFRGSGMGRWGDGGILRL